VPARDALATAANTTTRPSTASTGLPARSATSTGRTQPEPFRTYEGSRRIDLVEPLRAAVETAAPGAVSWRDTGYGDLFDPGSSRRRSLRPPGGVGLPALQPRPVGVEAIGPVALGALRQPVERNLHPTEGYVVCGPGAAGGRSGVFHYAPDAHALEERCAFDAASWTAAMTGLPEGSFLAALTSIHWREAWKYGERAFRYCQHDIGHAVAAMRLAAATMGWTCTIVPGWHRARSPHCSVWTGTWTSRVPSPRSRRA